MPKTRTVVFCMCWDFESYAQKSLAGALCNCKDKKSFRISELRFDCRKLFRFFRKIWQCKFAIINGNTRR